MSSLPLPARTSRRRMMALGLTLAALVSGCATCLRAASSTVHRRFSERVRVPSSSQYSGYSLPCQSGSPGCTRWISPNDGRRKRPTESVYAHCVISEPLRRRQTLVGT